MEAVITRIIEIEKQSAMDIEQAEDGYKKNVEARRLILEEEKRKALSHILSAEETRLNNILQALNKQSEEAFLVSGKDYENRFHDTDLITALKERIVDILLK
jgi:hypothetical protein